MPQGTFAEFVKTPKSPASTQTFADFVQSVRPKKQTGLLEPGNIDLFAQPTVKNPKGGMSTVFSSSYNVDGREVLLPAVTPDGRFLSTDDDVLGEYRRTGRHLGIFSDGDSATTYAKQLHEDYEAGKYTRKATPPPSRALLPNTPQDRVSDALVEQPKDLVSTLSKATGISAPPQAKPATFLGRLSDLGISSLEGAISVPETAVGFVDIPTGGRVGKALETVGFKPKAARDILETYYTEQQQFANRRVAEAEGLVDTAIAALKNPSTIVHTVVQSAPLMLGAGGIARTLVSRGVSAITAAAIGEGAVSAGQTAETIREASPSGTLMPKQATVAAVSGAVTGGLGAFGGKLAQRLGIADVDTLLAAGVKDATARTSLVKGVVYGAVQEGFVEELPQSVQEQIAQNIATEKPWDQGVSQAAVLGALAGAVMGGGAQATSAAFTPKTVQAPAPSEPQTFADFAAQPRPAPTSPATPASPAPVVAAPPSTQAERNAQTRAEAAVAGSASRDPVAVESGRALERRVQEGISPTGEERRAPETALVPSTLSKLTSDQLMTTLTEAQNRGLIQTWTATDQDEQGELLEVGILKNNGEWMHVGRASASLPSTGSTEVTDISPPKAERDEHSFSSTQVDLPAEHAAAVVQMAKAIPDEDIAEDGRAGDSEGSAPHVTVKYGIHSTDVEDVRKVLANEPPITVTLGATSFFPNSESGSGDVLKIDVDSPDLHRVNAKIAEALEVTDTHPTYVPHVTVAYLQPGKGQEYAGDESLKGQTMTLGALRFSTKDGQIFEIPLTGQASAQPSRIDTGTSQAQTVPSEAEPDEGEGVGAPRGATFDRVAPSVPTRLEGQRQREDRRTAHYRDVWNVVLTRAQAVDPAVTRTQLRKEFDARIALVDDLDTEFRESGHNLRTLLDAIATHGGISLEAEHLGGYAGELRWLRERKEPYGNFASVPNVFRVRSQDAVTGRPRTGVSLDDMVRILSGDPRFAYIQDIPDLFAALEDAARQGDVGMRGAIYPGTDELAKRAGMRPGEKWWEESWRESEQATEPEPLTAESYQRAFGGTKEQAEAIVQVYEAMGIPLERVLVAKGGVEGDLTQGEGQPRLTILHNIHADGLIHADKMGGLAVPSLGVVRAGDVFSGMGNVTLIGRPHLGDPRVEPIYDADIYSPTFPRAEYRKARTADAQKAVDAFKPFSKAFEDAHLEYMLWDNLVNSPNPHETISRMLRSSAAKAWFLSERGVTVEPVVIEKRLELPWVKYLDYQRFREVKPFNDERASEEQAQALREVVLIIREAIDKYLKSPEGRGIARLSKKAQAKSRMGNPQAEARWRAATMFGVPGDWINDPAGEMPMVLDWKIADNHNNLGKTQVDTHETEERINKAMAGRELEFKTWAEEKIIPLHPPPYVTVGRRQMPYTLNNIVDAMTGRVKATEKTLTFGEGKARAAAAKKFKDLEQMRRASKFLASEEEIDAKREEAKKALGAWRDQVVKYYGEPRGEREEFGRVWEGLDASMRALARWATGSKDATNMRYALAREGFRTSGAMFDSVVEDGVEAGLLWLKAPVPYFEAKPQRAVILNEFAGAAIPKGTSPEVRAILDKHGIRYREYDDSGAQTDPEFQRGEAIQQLEQELEREGVKVLFQGPKASVEFTEHGNAIIRALENPNVSSGLHETWHVARRFFFDRSIPQELREGITDDDILMAEDAFGATDGVWDHAAEEKWARAGERYFYNGDAPTARLKALFEKFARWLARIYQRIAGSPIDIEISPAMKQVFDRLVMRSGRLEEATSFDVDALEQELATLRGEDVLYQRDRSLPSTVGKEDRLATGEVQPRLPGAEAVREQEIATPTFEAPFTLTAQPSKVTKGKQDTLFQGAGKPPTDASRITPEQIAAVARRRKLTIDQVRKAAEQAGYTVVEPPRASWDAPEPSKLDTVIYTLQDRHIDTKRVLKAIADTALLIEDERDVYLQEELFHGRVAVKTETFLTDELKPLLREMAAKGVTVHGFDEYLHARHAEEANDAIAERNPEMPDGGSGMTTQEAKDYLATVPSEQRQAFEALAARVDQIVAGTRQMLVDYDLEAQETVDAWADAYQYYVPLQREDMGGGPGIGQGYSVRGPASKRRTGSHRTVVDILANLALQRERNIVRGEKNRVSTALYGLAKANPNPAFWTIAKPGITTSISAETGEPVDVVDLSYQGLDTVVMSRARREDGSIIQRGVAFNERDPRAQRMALALKNLDVDDLGEILSVSAKATRYFASINTQYNPVFGVVNLIRDAQEALLNLSSTAIAGKQAAVLSHIPSALSGIYADLRAERGGRHKGSAWAAEFEEFQREGGQTGYRDLYRTSSDRAKALEREIRAVGSGRAKRFGRAVFDWLSDYNLAMENATRLAAYHVAKENGLSRQRAASLAKNLTVNFNRKGQITREAGALYAFFNASAQGTARVVETLKGPAGAKIIAGGIAVGVLQALALAAAGFDDEEPPQFLRERSLIFPIGGKRYLTLPMPLGFYILPNLGRVATEFALAHGTKPATRVLALMNVAMDSFNPIGNAGLSVQTIAPTVVDPIVALAENKDWTGQPIAREDFNALQPTPGYTRAKDTATTVGIMISKGLNALSGGTDYTPGLLSPTPDQIDYLIAQATGGIGREAAKLEQTVSSVRSGEELPPYKVPLMGRFYGTTTGQASEARRFYDHLRELNRHELELRGRRAARQTTAPYLADHPDARLVGAANAVERRVSDMRKRKRTLVEKQAPATAVRAIEQRITATMRQFNAQVEAQMR